MDLSSIFASLGPMLAQTLAPGQSQAGVNAPGQLNPGDALRLMNGPGFQSLQQQTPGFSPFGNDPQTGAAAAPFGLNSYGVPFQNAAPGAEGLAASNAVNVAGAPQVGGIPQINSFLGQQNLGQILSGIFGQNQAGGVNLGVDQMAALNPANQMPQQPAPQGGQPGGGGLAGLIQMLFGGAQQQGQQPQPIPQGGGYQPLGGPQQNPGMNLQQLLGNLFSGGQQGQTTQRTAQPIAQQAAPQFANNAAPAGNLPNQPLPGGMGGGAQRQAMGSMGSMGQGYQSLGGPTF